MIKGKSIYIPSIDAKDIYIASNYITHNMDGYNLKLKDEQYNLRKFINSFDYSLDLIQLNKVHYSKYRKNNFTFTIKGKQYSTSVINLTFKYSVKTWNQMNRNTFVRFGYNHNDMVFIDNAAYNDEGEIIGIKVNQKTDVPVNTNLLCKCFAVSEVEIYDKKDKTKLIEIQTQYKKIREPETIMTSAQLRKHLYETGLICNGEKYIRFKRSSGSARIGKCLFITEQLYKPMFKYSTKGLEINDGQKIDLAALESCISLTTSSIIDTISISPDNILIIDDYESVFKENVAATYSENGCLITSAREAEITNSIWDGQSLIDSSLFGKYSQYGMLLLRNLMFKSCCFNCNIQQWFIDNNITEVSKLNGYTRAKKIEDIKLITTPSSIKYLKFGTLDHWLNNLHPNFGIVKHDKKPHFFDGNLVQTHYQLINTLQLSMEEVREFLKPSLEFAQLLRDNPAVVRYYINYPDIDNFEPLTSPMLNKNDVVFNLLCINNNFTNTKYYQEFLHDLLASYYKNLKNGHVLVNGNYSTLLGNPIEMLQHSIGIFNDKPQLGVGEIHSTRFQYGQYLLGSRSPHVTMGNIWLPYNTENKLIDCYFNLTSEIVCINSINENVLQRLSGADFDSDTVLLTDNEILINAAKKNYETFKTPTSSVEARKVKRYYTPAQQADLDIKTSVNLIGEIINLSQELNSLLWSRMYNGASYADIEDLYFDICQLDVMSGIEIDKAKKEFDIDNEKELKNIRLKYKEELTDDMNKKVMPHFFSHISRQKGYYDPKKKSYCKCHTSMDYLHTVVNGFKVKNLYKKDWLPFVSILDNKKFRTSDINRKQIDLIYSLVNAFMYETKQLFALDCERTEKAERYLILKEDLYSSINSQTIGYSTLFRMLSSLEDSSNENIKKMLLHILFNCNNKSFNEAIKKSSAPIEEISFIGTKEVLNNNLNYIVSTNYLTVPSANASSTSLIEDSSSERYMEADMTLFDLRFKIYKKECKFRNQQLKTP